MKFPKSLLLGLTGVMTIAATPAFSQSSTQNKVAFRCDIDQGVPVTVAYNPDNKQQQPINIITWKQERIDSQNIEQDCKKAAEKLGKRFDSQNPTDTDFYLAVETKLLNNGSSQSQMVLDTVCLPAKRGGSCRADGSNQLVRIKTDFQQTEAGNNDLSAIINRDFATLEGGKLRTIGVTYPKMKYRTIWNRLFGLR